MATRPGRWPCPAPAALSQEGRSRPRPCPQTGSAFLPRANASHGKNASHACEMNGSKAGAHASPSHAVRAVAACAASPWTRGVTSKVCGRGVLTLACACAATSAARTPRHDGPRPAWPRVLAPRLRPARRQPWCDPTGHGAAGFLPHSSPRGAVARVPGNRQRAIPGPRPVFPRSTAFATSAAADARGRVELSLSRRVARNGAAESRVPCWFMFLRNHQAVSQRDRHSHRHCVLTAPRPP